MAGAEPISHSRQIMQLNQQIVQIKIGSILIAKHNTFRRSFLSAILAQLAEQRFRKAWVAGSNPVDGSKFPLP
jgi:hypothetical protein